MRGTRRRHTVRPLTRSRSAPNRAASLHTKPEPNLAARVDEREHMLRVLSHDLTTPLMALGLTADALLERSEVVPLPSQTQQALRTLRSASRQVRAIVGELFDVTAMNHGAEVSLHCCHLSLDQLLEDALSLVEPTAQHARVSVVFRASKRVPTISCDRERMVRVLVNILGNAIKFTPARGQVRISTASRARTVRIEVTDTGPGVSRRDLPRLFEPYFTRGAGAQAGSGLGLYISLRIVEAHSGTIDVRRGPRGKGTTVVISLPLSTRSAGTSS